MAVRFTAGSYPVASRRHLLEPGTDWYRQGSGRTRFTVTSVKDGEVTFIRNWPEGTSTSSLPSGHRIPVENFLRNFKRDDEE